MKTLIKILLLTSVFLLVLFSCRKEQPEINDPQNACDCSKEISADFLMEERTSSSAAPLNFYTNTDTIIQDKTVRFSALEKDAHVTWYLGQETISGEQEVERYFGANYAGQSLSIICVVKKDPNSICFPNDDGYDSIVKYINVSSHDVRDSTYLLQGTFRVKERNGSDSVHINVDFRLDNTNNLVIDMFNYDGQGNDILNKSSQLYTNYREIRYATGSQQVRLWHQLSGEVRIEVVGNSPSIASFYYVGRQL
ncbi:hypothetical protein [Brumimicrobium mesophilum]|uniref:hypothetical protein n=1 Tax=Brumimicrobium mesophilum TaxID=392717 RepID=UPI000D140548|nr:hypothetical protein [Brumimicrobium mesophilum]